MKRLLVISPHFPPSTAAGVSRSVRLVRLIPDFGWEPYVLTRPPQCQIWPRVDGGDDELAGVRVWTVPCRSVWWHDVYGWPQLPVRWTNLPRLAARAFARVTYPFLPVDVDYPWALAATSLGVAVVRRYRIDLIWSTAPPLSALCLARRIWQRTGVPYVADFRDVALPVGSTSVPGRHRRNAQLEGAVLRDAAGFVYVAPPQGEVLAKKHPFVADMAKCLVYNGFEASEMSPGRVRLSDRPTILHGGNLYGTRRLDGFLAALAILRQRGRPESAGVVFRNFGSDRNAEMLTRGAARYGVSEALQTRKMLRRREFLSACRGADVLLVAVGHDAPPAQHAGAIPSKLYDYFSARRPILVVGPRDCEAARMVRRLNRGLGVADDLPEEIADAIERLLEGRGAVGKLDLSLEAVAEFESSATVRKMADFFSTVTSG